MNEIKVAIVGDSGVGKTSMLTRYVANTFPDSMAPTRGAITLSKELDIDGKIYQLRVWDVGGQEEFRNLAPMYYNHANIAIIVYDCTNPKSYQAVASWMEELKGELDNNAVFVICANKTDVEAQKDPDPEIVKKYAITNDALFFETSAVSNSNINNLFETAARKYLNTLHPAPKKEQEDNGCCRI